MILPHGVDGPALLVAYALVGRVLLALLPPGLPGRHALSALPATWAASHLLGGFALSLEGALLELLRLDPSAPLFLAPWLLLAIARCLTLPGAMVPRHELPRGAHGPLALILAAAAPLLVLAAALLGGRRGSASALAFGLADALALLALADHGLASARRTPLSRSVAVLVLSGALAAALASERAISLDLPLAIGSGVALGLPWLRHADRRAGALAVLAFASAALLGPREALYGAAGIVALWIHTATPSRQPLAVFAVSTFLPSAALGWMRRAPPDLELESVLPAIGAISLFVVAFALATRQRLVLARAEGQSDSGRLGSSMFRDALLLSILPPISRGETGSFESLAAALLPVAPIVVVEAGILLGRAETAGR